MGSSSPWSAAGPSLERAYKPKDLPEAEKAKIIETVLSDMPRIEKAVLKMARTLRGLEDVSQKHAIERMVAHWLAAATGSEDEAHALATHLHRQFDFYITEIFRSRH
jgi:hypothetical protein